MAEKTLKTRIIHKHDIESNWLKATNFVPKQGELIVYDKDANYNYERVKVGDGATNVNDLPFADANTALINANNYTDTKFSTLVGDTSVSSQINTAIAGKADLKHTHSLGDIDETYSDTQSVPVVSGQTSQSKISSISGKNLNVYVGYRAVLVIDSNVYEGIIKKVTAEGAQVILTSSMSSATYTAETATFTGDEITFSPAIPSGVYWSLTFYKDVPVIPERNIDSDIARKTDIKNKVDKETGKGLSTNDFTTDEKNKLAGIDENANNYTLPTASSTLGGVKTTSTVTSITGLTATPIINGVPYYKDTNTTYNNGTGISISNNKINHSNSITAKTAYGSTATSVSANGGSFTVTDIKYDAQGHITGSTDRTIKLSQTTYTLSGLGGVPTSRKVNGHALTADISLTASDVGAITGISGTDVIDALGYTPVNQENLGDFTGASATQAGDTGLVPAPSMGDQEKFLRGDGTWATASASGGDYLPLTGGTLTGNLTVDGTISVGTSTRATTAENILADKNGVISNADTCLAVGVYATNTSTTNLPFSTYGTLTVYKSAQNWIIQIWTSSTSTESSMYVRKNINGEGFGSWHKLLGSDLPVSIAQGGTGGTTASGALSNLGAFAKTGGTITGDTTISASLTVMPGHIYPQTVLRKTGNGSWISYGAVMEDAFLAQVVYEGAGGNREYYMLPSYTVGRTGSDWYNILTTKTVIYSSTQPSNASTGTIWLKPV